jgi:hypothetical protein
MLPTAEEVQYLHRSDMSRYYQQTKKSPVASIIFELLPNIYIHILQPTRTHINPVGSCRRLPAEAVGSHMSSWCTCSTAAADEAKRWKPASGAHLDLIWFPWSFGRRPELMSSLGPLSVWPRVRTAAGRRRKGYRGTDEFRTVHHVVGDGTLLRADLWFWWSFHRLEMPFCVCLCMCVRVCPRTLKTLFMKQPIILGQQTIWVTYFPHTLSQT